MALLVPFREILAPYQQNLWLISVLCQYIIRMWKLQHACLHTETLPLYTDFVPYSNLFICKIFVLVEGLSHEPLNFWTFELDAIRVILLCDLAWAPPILHALHCARCLDYVDSCTASCEGSNLRPSMTSQKLNSLVKWWLPSWSQKWDPVYQVSMHVAVIGTDLVSYLIIMPFKYFYLQGPRS